VAAVAGVLAGSLSVASLPTLAADPLSGMVGDFRRHHQGVRVDLAAPEDTEDLFDLVESGKCELGLTEATDVPGALKAVSLGAQELVFILPPGSAPNGESPFEVAELGEMPLVVAPGGTSTRRLLDRQFEAMGRQPTLAVVSAQREAILPLVVAGAGAALVPVAMALIAEGLGAVVARPTPPAIRDLVLVHRHGILAPAAERFVELSVHQTRAVLGNGTSGDLG
jgi:LysR family carnitine catabolism transcriptional activator